jgi:hypothetical protein
MDKTQPESENEPMPTSARKWPRYWDQQWKAICRLVRENPPDSLAPGNSIRMIPGDEPPTLAVKPDQKT